jgi:hypothetical protein
MAGNWNPNAPGVLGPEWRGFYGYLDKRTASPFKAMRLPSTVTEVIKAIQFAIGPTINTTAPNFKCLEVYREEDIVQNPDNVTIERFVPNAHGTGTGIGNWRTEAGGSTNIHLSIDDVVKYPPIDNLFIRNNGALSNTHFHMNTSAFPLTRRVGRLRLRGVVGSSGTFRDIYFRLLHIPTLTVYIPPGDRIRTHYYGSLHQVDLGDINPVTLLPWTPVDIRGFASANNVWQVRIVGAGTPGHEIRLHSLELEVQTYEPENRKAIGVYDRPNGLITGGLTGGQNRHKFIETQSLVEPDGAGGWKANWTKQAGEDYIYVFRSALDRLVSGLATRSDDLHPSFVGGQDRDGRHGSPVLGQFAGDVIFGSASTAVHAMVLRAGPFNEPLAWGLAPLITGAGTVASDDSQPHVVRFLNLVADNAKADDTNMVCQEYQAPATNDYIGVRFVVKPPADGVGTLRITVHSMACTGAPAIADTQVGGSIDVNAAELLSTVTLPNLPGYREVREFLSSAAAFISGSCYYIRLTKISGTAGTAWEVTRLHQPLLAEAGFQGETSNFTYLNKITNVATTFTEDDLGIQLYEQPDPPANVIVERLTQVRDLTDPTCVTDQSCVVPTIDYCKITWDSPNTYDDFDHWEIQRQEPDDTWQDVGRSEFETVRYFEDYESIREHAVNYRVRAIMHSGAFSNWWESNQVTPTTYGAEVVFCTNARPELNIAYTHDPDVPMEFLDHENDELMAVQGSDFRVAFLDPHDRGMSLAYRIAANIGAQPINSDGLPIAGERVFDPLRNITRGRGLSVSHTGTPTLGHEEPTTALPYVCVNDYEGSRRFAYVRLSSGSRGMPFWRYWCTATIIPVTNTPAVIAAEGNMLVLDGAPGTIVSTPDVSTLDITGDITLMAELHLSEWVPGPIQTLVSKFGLSGDAGGDPNHSYMLQLLEDGRFRVITSPNGTIASQIVLTCNTSISGFIPETGRLAIAAALDVNVGGTNKEARFYVAPSIHGPWTQINLQNTAGTTSIHSGPAPLVIGDHHQGAGGEAFTGHVLAARVVNGLIASTDIRADPNFANQRPGVTGLTDSEGLIWTLAGAAEIMPASFFP